jgi:hypothetical protein
MSGAPSSQPTNYPQYLRKIGLVVYAAQGAPAGQGGIGSDAVASATQPLATASSDGLDLSQMRIKFHVEGMDFDRPKTAIIRVYNLATSTQNTIKSEFQKVILQAGYENGAYGVIFSGTIMRIKTGRESAVDTFLEISAADGDLAFLYGFVSKTLAGGSSLPQQAKPPIDAMKATGGVTSADITALEAKSTQAAVQAGVLSPRPIVQFGIAKGYLNDIADSAGCSWTIENGVLTFTSNTGYTPGQVVVLNSQTGMIGIPEQTNGGIEISALLNPNIKIGTRVQINNAELNQTQLNGQTFPTFNSLESFATLANDGIYRVVVVEHLGDSRGNEWYTNMICLDLDPSAAPAQSVLPSG